MVGYLRFVPKFFKLTSPLPDLTQKHQKFKWNAEAQTAFEILKEKLSQPPILIHPNFDKEFVLCTDSSDNCL